MIALLPNTKLMNTTLHSCWELHLVDVTIKQKISIVVVDFFSSYFSLFQLNKNTGLFWTGHVQEDFAVNVLAAAKISINQVR